ncbi:hypothetical protein EDD18DRAFT_1114226 [Armillaria luteobubalina]|uniref:WD40 repeat-like protein n=1 Tax=Armillaria luteobubalina TaxID=153913 RepID=A0AA39P607_9AGAR|nr:hypothetical protein EDD18DRAFT_1114226 [Armillaria luteobubalina]
MITSPHWRVVMGPACWQPEAGTKLFCVLVGLRYFLEVWMTVVVGRENWSSLAIDSSQYSYPDWQTGLKPMFWDLRTPGPIRTAILHDYPTSIDVESPLLVVGMAKRYIEIFHLDFAGSPFKARLFPLKSTTTVVSCNLFHQGSGDRLCSEKHNTSVPFPTNCEDKRSDSGGLPVAHAVNDISFHPVNGTLATLLLSLVIEPPIGSDGTIKLWDKNRRKCLKRAVFFGTISMKARFRAVHSILTGTILTCATNRRSSVGVSPKYQIKLHMCNDEVKGEQDFVMSRALFKLTCEKFCNSMVLAVVGRRL